MRISGSRAFAAVGFSVLLALTAACGGSNPEAKAPTPPPTEVAESTPVGSPAPAASPESTSEPPKDTTPSSTKGSKKSGGKPKKKATQAAGKNGAT